MIHNPAMVRTSAQGLALALYRPLKLLKQLSMSETEKLCMSLWSLRLGAKSHRAQGHLCYAL